MTQPKQRITGCDSAVRPPVRCAKCKLEQQSGTRYAWKVPEHGSIHALIGLDLDRIWGTPQGKPRKPKSDRIIQAWQPSLLACKTMSAYHPTLPLLIRILIQCPPWGTRTDSRSPIVNSRKGTTSRLIPFSGVGCRLSRSKEREAE